MEYQSIEQLKQSFLGGDFVFDENITINGIEYHPSYSSEYSPKKMYKEGIKSVLSYFTPTREQAKSVGLDHGIAFLWGFTQGTMDMIAYDVRLITKSRVRLPIKERLDNGDSVNIAKEKIVGDVVDLIITSLPGSTPIKAKIDTGADVSSLHADDWSIDNEQVTFTSPELSENRITIPLIEKQAIKLSNGDTEYRPVIELNIKINEQQLTNCMFNLNDRGAMQYPVLIGQNVLEAGGFFIDPTINDEDAPTMEDFENYLTILQVEAKDDIIPNNKNKSLQKVIDFVSDEMNK